MSKREAGQNWMIITGGGKGKRMGGDVNKIFLPLLRKPLILHSLEIMESLPLIDKIVITIGSDDLDKLTDLLNKNHFKKVVKLIEASATRQDSTLKALKWIHSQNMGDETLIGVHNAVNPLVSKQEIEAVFQAAKEYGGALLAMPTKDTIKISGDDDLVQHTPIREFVWCAQTPQVGTLGNMLEAFTRAKMDGFYGTDDTQLLERIGITIKIVPCSVENFKITYPSDLILANEILKRRKNV